MSKNHPKIYTKRPNGGYGNKQRDLALIKTWPRYWQKGRVKRRQNSLHVYPRLKFINQVLLNVFQILMSNEKAWKEIWKRLKEKIFYAKVGPLCWGCVLLGHILKLAQKFNTVLIQFLKKLTRSTLEKFENLWKAKYWPSKLTLLLLKC